MIFKNGYKITQKYGERVSYYKQVSNGSLTKGHEGLDCIPVDGPWTIYAVDDGEVIRDKDNPRDGGVYGNYVVIWNKQKRRAFWYCHNATNYVSMGQQVKAGDRICTMGATGNVSGAHLHLNYVETDAERNRLHRNNGSLGYLDPLPVLQSLEVGDQTGDTMTEQDAKDIDSMRKLRKHNSNYKDADSILKAIGSKDSAIGERDEKIIVLEKALAEAGNELTAQLAKKDVDCQQRMSDMKADYEVRERGIIDAWKERLFECENGQTTKPEKPRKGWHYKLVEILDILFGYTK